MSREKALELKQQGNTLYKERRFEEALVAYNAALQEDPSLLMLHYNIAAVKIEQEKYDEAISELDKALDKRMDYPLSFEEAAKIYNRKANCQMKLGDFSKAVMSYKKALTEVQDRKTRAALKEAERAMIHAEKEAYKNPELAEEHRLKGNAYFKEKNYPAAKAEYDEAIARNPDDAKLYTNRAAAFCNLFEFPSALKDCEKAIQLDPNFVKGWSRKGLCHLRLKEYHKAKEAYQKGLEIDSDNAECKTGLSNVQFAIMQQMYQPIDEAQVERAMADPEIQAIVSDPQMNIILSQIRENPAMISKLMADPKVSIALEKLIAAGLLRYGQPTAEQ